MKKISKCVSLFILAAALLCGCSQSDREKAASAQKSRESASQSVTEIVSKAAAQADIPPAVSSVKAPAEAEAAPKPSAANAELMYITRQKYAKTQPRPDAERAAFYNAGEPVYVVGRTENGYLELYGGGYINCAYVRKTCEPFQPDEVRDNRFEKAPVRFTRKNGVYNASAALKYAESHWNENSSLCAEFASECLTAGGLKYDIASATELFNALTADNTGTVFEVGVNPDGTVKAPDYMLSGDVIFYYCEAENLMVHAAIYSGRTPSGKAKAYAHNPCDSADEPLTYKQYCPGTCGYPLERAVVVCLNGRIFE